MAIKINDFGFGERRIGETKDGELEVTFTMAGEHEAISFLGALLAFVASYSAGTAPTLTAAPTLEKPVSLQTFTSAPPVTEPVKTSKRASKPAAAPAPEPAPTSIVQPQPAPVQAAVTPALVPAPVVSAPAPVVPVAAPVGGLVPGIPKDAPAELVAAKSFREVIVFFLGHGVSQGDVIEAACAQYRAQVPLIDKLMQPQDDPEAVLSARIKRALVVLQKPA